MQTQRIIRNAVLCFAAAFLVVVALGPTHPSRTLWQIQSGGAGHTVSHAISNGVDHQPVSAPSPVPKNVQVRLWWRLQLTEHYAKQTQAKATKELAWKLNENGIGQGSSPIMPVGFQQGVTTPKEFEAVEDDFWSRQHEKAEVAYEKLQTLESTVAKASPVKVLPGDPTRQTLLAALLVGLVAGLMITALGVTNARSAPSAQYHPDDATVLVIPASWYRVRGSSMNLVIRWSQRLSVTVITAIVLLSVFHLYDEPLAFQRAFWWPLAEIANAL